MTLFYCRLHSVGIKAKLGRMNKLLCLLNIFIFLFLSACGEYYERESPQLTIEEGLDTLWIRNEPNHGYYEIRDTLTLFSGWPLLDSSYCDSMEHRSEPIWTSSQKPYVCTVSDLYPPFQVYKRNNSDTLFIIKDGKTVLFRMKH